MKLFNLSFGLLFALVMLAGCNLPPQPLTSDEFEHIAVNDRSLIFDAQEPITGELTQEYAMAMALKYNLEHRVRLLEETIANKQIDMTRLDLLPTLAASAGFLDRDNVNAASSESVLTGNQSLEPSTSQDRDQFNINGRFSWNLLDFGVGYLQAKQDADRYLMAQQARHKVMLSLLQEVRGAYWQAVAMQQMSNELDWVGTRVDEQLAYWQKIREQQLRPPIAVLFDIRDLLKTRAQLDELRRSIDTSHARLANLINAESIQALNLPQAPELPDLLAISDDLDAMELAALSNSADYASEVYRVRIDQLESRKAIMQLLPGIEFAYGASYDDNSFLYNNHWGEFTANLTGDLTRLFFVKQIRKFREAHELLTMTRKLAVNMAVVTGVHITWQDYHNALAQYDRAQRLATIDVEIAFLVRNAEVNQKETGAATIQNDLQAFRSKVAGLQAYAEAQEAYGAFVASLGINPVPVDYQRYSVSELAQALAAGFERGMSAYTMPSGISSARPFFEDLTMQNESLPAPVHAPEVVAAEPLPAPVEAPEVVAVESLPVPVDAPEVAAAEPLPDLATVIVDSPEPAPASPLSD